jgi:hypothetical protein
MVVEARSAGADDPRAGELVPGDAGTTFRRCARMDLKRRRVLLIGVVGAEL